MSDILRLIFWFTIMLLIGWSVLSLIFFRKTRLSGMEKLALSYPVGLGLVSIEMAVLSFFNIRFNVTSILICWFPLFIAASVSRPDFKVSEKKRDPFTLLEKFFISTISLWIIYVFFRALIKPIEAYDAIAIYALKSKIFYMAKTVPADFFRVFKDHVPHVEYPLLLPLSETSLYIFMGRLNDLLVKAIFPLYYVSALAVLYVVLRRFLDRKPSMLFVFLLATIPQFSEYATNGYADLLLAFYCSAGFFYLFLWLKEREGRFLVLSFVLSILGVWTKAEGVMLFGINLIVVAVCLLSGYRPLLKQGSVYILIAIMSIISYLYLIRSLGLKLHDDFNNDILVGVPSAASGVKRIFQILYEYQRQFFGPKKWNIIWIVFILGFMADLKRVFLKEIKAVTLAIILIFCAYASIYMALPGGSISWHLSTTASRFFIHFLAVVVFWVALLFKDLKLEI